DPYMLAAIMSSVSPKNIGPMMKEVIRPGKPAPAVLLEKLLILGNAFRARDGIATLLATIATPQDGGYRPSQYMALAGMLDALDRQNTSLAKMWAAGNDELKASLKKLTGVFSAARKTVSDPKAARPEQVLAIAIL